MLNFFKSREAKFVTATALSFILIFSMMVTSISALAPEPGVNESPTESLTGAPSIDRSGLARGEGTANLEEGLKEALTAVKLHFDIDEEIFTNFNWNFSPGDGYYNPDVWYINWNSADWNASINANITTGGILLNYSKYEWSEARTRSNIRFAEISKAEAKNAADAFLKKILGDEFADFRMTSNWLGYPSDRYSLNYVLTHSGYDYPNYGLSVDVDKLTGEIVQYYRYGHRFFYDLSKDILDYEDASTVISKDEALASYLENIGLELVYASYNDWQTRELKIHPVYRLKNTGSQYISAADGSLVDISYDIYPEPVPMGSSADNYAADAAAPAEAEEAGGVKFSQAELDAMAKAGNYITADEAVAAMIKAFDLTIDAADFNKYANLNADYINKNQYLWNINLNRQSDTIYEYYYAAVDARTGDIINYNTYCYDYTGGRKGDEPVDPELLYTYDEVRETVIEKIKALLPAGVDFDKDFEILERSYIGIVPLNADEDADVNEDADEDAEENEDADVNEENEDADEEEDEDEAAEESKSNSYYFYFARKVNGIEFVSNGIGVNFDNITGKITSYYLSWYEDAKFPSIDDIVSPETALEGIAEFSGYNIVYMSNGMTEAGKINVSLLYSFDNPVNADPYTGKPISWNFEELTKSEVSLPDYQDLSGHWSEDIVNTLTDNGIYVWGGEAFEPGKGITKSEFIEYLRFYAYNYWTFTQLESSIFVSPQGYYRDFMNTADDPDADKVITRQDAAKLVCEIAGYGLIGSHFEIFIYPFDDAACDDEYKGYISIMKTLGLINGDGEGNFNAKAVMTRAEAAAIIYNIIMAFNAVG